MVLAVERFVEACFVGLHQSQNGIECRLLISSVLWWSFCFVPDRVVFEHFMIMTRWPEKFWVVHDYPMPSCICSFCCRFGIGCPSNKMFHNSSQTAERGWTLSTNRLCLLIFASWTTKKMSLEARCSSVNILFHGVWMLLRRCRLGSQKRAKWGGFRFLTAL